MTRESPDPHVDVDVVFLTNFFSPDVAPICREWARRVRRLTILVSVDMEGNRHWRSTDAGLDVRVQRTWTITRTDRHPAGYSDVNYVHLPRDTLSQLRRLKPDVVVSTELGPRSLLASLHRKLHRTCRHVIAVSTTGRVESSRRSGWRDAVRRRLLAAADAVTFHGPECRRFIELLRAPESKLHEWIYAADPQKCYAGELVGTADRSVRLLTVGQLIDRKGIVEAHRDLSRVAADHPDREFVWTLLGDGPLKVAMASRDRPANLNIDLAGHADADQIRHAYRDHELLLFPTLGDEWGLVTDEALHSGLCVIGSRHAQSVNTLIQDGTNGWAYDPERTGDLRNALTPWLQLDDASRMRMRRHARGSVTDRTPTRAAVQICELIGSLVDPEPSTS